MKRQIVYMLSAILCLHFAQACGDSKKTTIVTGTVTDRSSGLTMTGVKVLLNAKEIGEPNEHDKNIAHDEALTDQNGEYAVEVSARSPDYVLFSITKESQEGPILDNYAMPVHRFVDNGDCVNMDFALTQFNAYLRLIFENQNTFGGKMYCFMSGPAFENHNANANSWPRILPIGQSSEDLFLVPGSSPIYLVWDTLKLTTDKLRRLDSVTCIPNDTTTYVLRF